MNIDDLLSRAGNATPRRPLNAGFTERITNHITTHPRTAWWRSPKGILMKALDKPAMAIAAFVATIAISGTAYAAVVNWPNITAMFSGEQPTNGGRIVQVDTKNCSNHVSAFNITKPADERDTSTRYFKVKDGSKLTNDQITQMVLGNCEQDAQSNVLQQKLSQQPTEGVIGGYIDNTITAISAGSITLEADIPVGTKLEHVTKTFTHIAPDVAVFYKADTLTFGDLKVGDHVGFAYRATGDALAHSETLPPSQLNTDEATIVMVIKNTPATTAAVDYQKHLGSDFEEVVKCNKTPSGYCNVEEYLKN